MLKKWYNKNNINFSYISNPHPC
ncbi:unnamed protein product [Spirodela intermedia]|uniref:Uncharacterized protein n=1 Tax=Spirodela intermedia TaxID=51605 RepID=A0A7I8KSM4_SPIIN|nr:unnamed protein product [Spirodela intermedia]